MSDRASVHECVVNVSEGRDEETVVAIASAAGDLLLDVHSDRDHNRSVLTLAGPPSAVDDAARAVAAAAVARIDIRSHSGAHPRIGALDVVPFVALGGWPLEDAAPAPAIDSRDRLASWAGRELGLPCFLYGPDRSLPEVRREAWKALRPDAGPGRPHPTAGAAAVGARPLLVAYNLWLSDGGVEAARRVAADLRGTHLRALALVVGASVQVSCNLIAPARLGPAAVFDAVASRVAVERAELVGLLPTTVLEAIPPHRWRELGLSASSTIEARLEQAGLDGGRIGVHEG